MGQIALSLHACIIHYLGGRILVLEVELAYKLASFLIHCES